MPNATLQDNLVDDLVADVVDELRADLYLDMGIRQHDVYLVRRRWSGPRRSEGTVTILSEVLISPPPLIRTPDEKLRWDVEPHGREESGEIDLTEVSLTFTEAELTGAPIGPREEFYYRIVDARGQGGAVRYFIPRARPYTDREKTLGWIVPLIRAEVSE